MTAKEFALNWEIQQRMITWSSPESRKDEETRRAARRAIVLENAPLPAAYSAPFDPATASPEQIEHWLANFSI